MPLVPRRSDFECLSDYLTLQPVEPEGLVHREHPVYPSLDSDTNFHLKTKLDSVRISSIQITALHCILFFGDHPLMVSFILFNFNKF